jgi:hypothetical protein
MKKYVVSLLVLASLLLLQTPHAVGHSVRGGFASRGFVVRASPRHFVSPSVAIVNPRPVRVVRVSPFARRVIIVPHHRFVGNTVIAAEPFSCFGDSVIVQNGSQVFCSGD